MAFPPIISILSHLKICLFLSVRLMASGFLSTAYTLPLPHCKAISTDTEPVPLPISQQTESFDIPNFDIITLRTSDLVIGTFPLTNSRSGIPDRFNISQSEFTTVITDSNAVSVSVKSSAVPQSILSFSYPRFSPI